MIEPAGELDQRCGEGFLERRFTAAGTVSATVEALSRQIERKGSAGSLDVGMDADCWLGSIDTGSFAKTFAELIGNGILDAQGGKLTVGDGRIDQGGVHGKGGFGGQVFVPQDLAGAGVEGIGGGGVKTGQFEQDALGKTRPQTGPVPGLQVAMPADRAGLAGNVLAAKAFDFFQNQRFQSRAAGGGETQGGFFFLFSGRAKLDFHGVRDGICSKAGS